MFILPGLINEMKGKTIASIEPLNGHENVLVITFTDGDRLSLMQLLRDNTFDEILVTIWRGETIV